MSLAVHNFPIAVLTGYKEPYHLNQKTWYSAKGARYIFFLEYKRPQTLFCPHIPFTNSSKFAYFNNRTADIISQLSLTDCSTRLYSPRMGHASVTVSDLLIRGLFTTCPLSRSAYTTTLASVENNAHTETAEQ
jgi:hypothetical protein